jgi:hypothetical protein
VHVKSIKYPCWLIFMEVYGKLHGFSMPHILCSFMWEQASEMLGFSQETNMSTSKNMKAQWSRGLAIGTLLMVCVMATLAPRGYAQAKTQPESQTMQAATAKESNDPAVVAKELQAMKAHIAQLESQLGELAAFVAPSTNFAARSMRSAPAEVTLTGLVSCAHCQGMQPLHKGHTQYSWAVYSVSQGDDIVLVSHDKTYKLKGDKDQLLKYMSAKARVTGRLDNTVLQVQTIGRPEKGE